MIIPFLDGFLNFSKAPITWLIVLFNLFMFTQNYVLSKQCQDEFAHWYEDNDFLFVQGQVYKQYNRNREIASIDNNEFVGKIAFKDEAFMQKAGASLWKGDQVAIDYWKKDLAGFLLVRNFYPPLILGVSDSNKDWLSFFSYQFYHEGFTHLLGNLLLILILGIFLERRHSGLLVFFTYLTGGSLAAWLFSMTGGLTGAPLVGASGSLCALIGFLFVAHFKEKTRLFYIILPANKYMGFVFVPTFMWVLWLCMIDDLAGIIAKPEVVSGGIAHMVHIYGFLMGCGLAFLWQKYSIGQIRRKAAA